MKTKLLYFDNPELTQNDSVIVDIESDEKGFCLIPRESCYFPGGGGQEADSGEILINDKFHPITGGKLIDGQLRLYVDQPPQPLLVGMTMGIRIDKAKREQNSRLHSAGHLLSSVAYEEMQLDLLPIKGFHFEAGSHVEFSSDSGVNSVDLDEINKRINRTIDAKLPITSKIVTPRTEAYLNSFRTPGYTPTNDAQVRLVKIGDYLAYACGGTHVLHTGQLQGLTVTSYKSKKGNLRIKYELDFTK